MLINNHSSPTLAVAQARSRSLYRDWYRAAPEICQLYALDVPYPTLRAKIRQIFDRYAHVKDIQAIDVLIAKSHMEYQEFVNVWKMPSQVMRYFESEQVPPAHTHSLPQPHTTHSLFPPGPPRAELVYGEIPVRIRIPIDLQQTEC
ncbi:hypothetical protein PTTG_01022 [Puccinia triticina 1-1 BBBD Race 1]|uniref:NADH dehydrogenase (Ubiquinone) 1 alpha subcomplex 6 n=1 Tax=Puccinia triticina (isolate 1-1 / race 1 (BBBD)) TaxID=630390 RepID=A0A0C4EJV1_PUCT1|nr:hypothetical protein PTTG_01022 [Puccinia triticina 1-1 BBBD Race 1]